MRVPSLCSSSAPVQPASQQPFANVAPVVGAALVLGAGVGFVFAAVLSVTEATHTAGGPWWQALVQAHGHIQLYGWAGLFVIGVALHLLPRLRGAGLARPELVPWALGALVGAMVLRALCQPLIALDGASIARLGLALSGVLECSGVGIVILLLLATSRRAAPIRAQSALGSVAPFVALAFASLGAASVVNLVNVVRAAALPLGIVPSASDNLNVTLGLLGFLVPMTLAMSARSLPMYAGLEAVPARTLWPIAFTYLAGLMLAAIGVISGTQPGTWSGMLAGVGFTLVGAALTATVLRFMWLMRARGHLPSRVAALAPAPAVVSRRYVAQVKRERSAYGPFVALVASAFSWALLGGALLLLDGITQAAGQTPLVTLDAARHSLAVGYVALLICGIAPRMIPGFSNGRIRSRQLVTATLWLGNGAAFLRVGSLLAAPLLEAVGARGNFLDQVAFGLSGPLGLSLALCLAINLWPALRSQPQPLITLLPRVGRSATS
jgi:uncharacterized protein involved in response to NO